MRNLEQAVSEAVPRVWVQIRADVPEDITLEDAAELCLDADRPVTFGYMTAAEYKAINTTLPAKIVDEWAIEALRPYFTR